MARIRRLAVTQDWLIAADQAKACGAGPRDVVCQIRAGRWTALAHGVYLIDSDMYGCLPQRVWWRAALLAQGPDSCLVAGSGARALGAQGLPPTEHVIEVAHVSGTSRRRRQLAPPNEWHPVSAPTVQVRQLPVRADEIVVVRGLTIRRADLTIVDAAIEASRPVALSLMDSALHQGLVTPAALQAAIDGARGRPGIQRLRRLAERADGRAESPVESRVRLACIDGDVPPDDLQYPVCTADGHVIAIGDLGWYRRRRRPLLAEADGESVHALPEAVYRDRRRTNALAGEACDVVRFTYVDALRPAYIANVIRRALTAA